MPQLFNKKDQLFKIIRYRKFNPESFFFSIILLVSGRKKEGYQSALWRWFGVNDSPVKSSLSKFRKKISYKFFQTAFYKLVASFMPFRDTLKGRRVYAIDGKWIYVPRSKELEKKGFTGRKMGGNRQTYKLRMHLVHAYDVLSGVSKDLMVHSHQDEIEQAIKMVNKFESGSIVLYDRYYLSRELVHAHQKKRNYFVLRLKGGSLFKELAGFIEGKKDKKEIDFEGSKLVALKVAGKGGRYRYYLTNMPMASVSKRRVDHLYRERWDVESSFKELVEGFALEQWHTKDYNGILQELYARFWIYNFTKIQIYLRSKKRRRTIGKEYFRANTKLIAEYVVSQLKGLYQRKRKVTSELTKLINKSTERRKRYQRSYPRELKGPASPYVYNNTMWVFDE